MHDFIRFMKHLLRILHFARGIILSLGGLLFICVLVTVQTEGLSIGHATYFVLITAMTIGYGDITPETDWGRVASVAAGVIGMLSTGILVAISVRALGQAAHEKEQDMRRDDH